MPYERAWLSSRARGCVPLPLLHSVPRITLLVRPRPTRPRPRPRPHPLCLDLLTTAATFLGARCLKFRRNMGGS